MERLAGDRSAAEDALAEAVAIATRNEVTPESDLSVAISALKESLETD